MIDMDMTLNEYQDQCRRTQRTDLPLWALWEHALFLIAAEVGEIHSLHQKVHQGHPLDEQELMLECGDLAWGLCELCDVYGWTLEEVARANIVSVVDLALHKPNSETEFAAYEESDGQREATPWN